MKMMGIIVCDCIFVHDCEARSRGAFLSDDNYRERRGYDGRRRGSRGGEEEEPVHPPERAGQQPAELQQHNWQSQDI